MNFQIRSKVLSNPDLYFISCFRFPHGVSGVPNLKTQTALKIYFSINVAQDHG